LNGIRDSRKSVISGKFLDVMLQEDGEDQLDGSCERRGSITLNEEGEECPI
jgi:hypothetical protein